MLGMCNGSFLKPDVATYRFSQLIYNATFRSAFEARNLGLGLFILWKINTGKIVIDATEVMVHLDYQQALRSELA